MSVPVITLPAAAIVIAVVMLVTAVGVVIDLTKSHGIRCAIGERLAAIRQALADRGGGSSGVIGGFPVRGVALFLVGVFALALLFSSLTAFRSPPPVEFEAWLGEPGSNSAATTASPAVGSAMLVRATLKPSQEHLSNPAVVISGPSTIAFSWCRAYVSGEKIHGFAKGPQGRIGLGDLGSATEVTILCSFLVVRRIRSLEAVRVELTGADAQGAEEEELYLEPPERERGQEAAEAHADAEIRRSPALWEQQSMIVRKGAFREQGDLWPLLDPHRLHGPDSIPEGRATTLHRLEDTRVQRSRFVSLQATITSRPVTMEEFTAKGSGLRATRQVFAIGGRLGERGAWCATTRSTAQPRLRKGDRLQLEAVVVEWGRSGASDGVAVMLHCPALRVLGSIGVAVRTSEAGATAVPDRFNRGGGR